MSSQIQVLGMIPRTGSDHPKTRRERDHSGGPSTRAKRCCAAGPPGKLISTSVVLYRTTSRGCSGRRGDPSKRALTLLEPTFRC